MNARDKSYHWWTDGWPLPEEMPAWWADRPLTAEQLDAMAEEYAREQREGASADTGPVDAAGTYTGNN
jgi:hypothetical protein